MAGTWMMEPDHSIGTYDAVPWYRRTWFLVTMIFLFWPVALIVSATGDFYQKANRKTRRRSDAEVWRSTGTGRVVMACCGVGLTALYGGQLVSTIGDLADQDDSPSTQAVAPASDDSAPTPTAPSSEIEADSGATGASTAAETVPASSEMKAADQRLTEVHEKAVAVAGTALGGEDMTTVLVTAFGDDRYADLQLPSGFLLTTIEVSREDDDRPVSTVSATFETSEDIDSVLAALSTIAADRGHEAEERTDETDDGVRTVSLEHGPRADGPLLFEGLSFTITTTDDGSSIRLFRYLVDDEPLAPSALLEQARPTFPLPSGFQATGAEIRLSSTDFDPVGIALQVLGPEPDMDENAVFDAIIEAAAPLWAPEEISSDILRKLESGDRAALVSVSPSSRRTIVRINIS